MKIGIGFVTGRAGFRHLFKTYVNNWNEHGFLRNEDAHLHLFVAYDLSYSGTTRADYSRVDPALAARLDSLSYFGTTAIRDERRMLVNHGVLSAEESELLFGEGYGKKRNAVVWHAIKAGMDRLLFIDDDEYPLAAVRGDPISWHGQSILSCHLKASEHADITHGRHCGYVSPIPRIGFDRRLTETMFAEFIEALSNDIVTWDKTRRIVLEDGGVTYADESVIRSGVTEEVPLVKGMKFISGANLCLNLRRGGGDAPFFNPPEARGEDTFLSTCLADKKVVRVPAYTFHDAYLRYQTLLHGVLPRSLSAVEADDTRIVKRFAKAALGWTRYKPLLTWVSDPGRYQETIEFMEATFTKLAPVLHARFGLPEFSRLVPELKRFSRRVREHADMFERTKEAWSKALAWAKSQRQ